MAGDYFTGSNDRAKTELPLYKSFFMSRSSKLFIGLLSFLPIILGIVFLITLLNMFPEFIYWDKNEPDAFTVFQTIRPIIILGILLAFLSICLLVFFIMHLVRNKKIESTERIIWVLVFLFAGGIGYPVYWYMRVWKEDI